MNTFKKTLALVLTLAMVLSVVVVPASAAEYTDVAEGSWFTESILRWSDAAASVNEKGEAVPVLAGYPDGSFQPDKKMTRAEVAKTLAGVFGLVEKAENKFTDLVEGAWYVDPVLAAAEAEMVKGDPDGAFRPDDSIKREEAFLILYRAMLLDAGDPATLEQFEDESVIANGQEVNLTSAWAQEGVASMVEHKFVQGDDNNKINARAYISRAELIKVLDRMIGAYVDAEGTVSLATDSKDVETSNLVVVNANCVEDVTVTATEKGVEIAVGGEKVELIPENGETVEVVIVGRESREVEDVVYVEGADEEEQAHFVEKEEEPTKPECTDHVMGETEDNCKNCAVEHVLEGTCSICGTPMTEVVPAHTHTFVDGVCECCGMTEEEAMKFNLNVSSNGEEVDMLVTNDYAAQITVTPGKVSAASVKLYAAMKDVDSLDVSEMREHSVEISTGLEGDPALATWLSEAFDFEGAELDVTVIDIDETEYESDYIFNAAELDEDGIASIKAEPVDVEQTRAAWQVITSHVKTETQDTDDSSVTIGNGSYLRVVDEKLGFEKQVDGDLVLNNFNDLGAMETEIRNTVRVYTDVEGEAVVEAYLTAGTELAVGSSVATLTDDCLIEINDIGDGKVAGILSDLRDAEGTYAAASQVVTLINNLIGSIDESNWASVTITFTEPAVELGTKFYFSVSAPNEGGNGTTTVDMEVYEDYSFEINVPMNTIDASKVNLYVEMNNVASLGVDGKKSHSLELNDVVNATPELGVWLSEVKDFKDVTIIVNVQAADGTMVSCAYDVIGDGDQTCPTITGTPVDVEETRAAWQSIASHIDTTKTQETDDSYILIKNGSALAFNGETLMFETENDLKLDNFSDFGSLKQNIKDNVCVVEQGRPGEVNMMVTAGTELAVGQSIAALENDCMIRVSSFRGLNLPAGVLSGIRDAANADNSNYALCEKLVNMLGELIIAADEADEIMVDIIFAPAE